MILSYAPRDIPALLRTPVGRQNLQRAARRQLWPLTSRLAALYRRSVVPDVGVAVVVGSLGKTTTARAVFAALGHGSQAGEDDLSALVAGTLRLRRGDRHAVFEVGVSGPGQMARYGHMLRPTVVVVTAIASEHWSSFRTLENTRNEKADMVRALPRSGLAVLNGDDPNVRWMATQTPARVLTFGFEPGNDVRAEGLETLGVEGSHFTLVVGGEARAVRSRLLGRTMVYSVLAAVAVALGEGVELDGAIAALERLEPSVGRLQPVRLASGAVLLRDDHKSPLETAHAALDVLTEMPARRRIAVLGDLDEPPEDSESAYAALGERLAAIAERTVLVGHSARAYAVGAERGGLSGASVLYAGESVSRAAAALADLQSGDVVLVKGRTAQRLERLVLSLQGRTVACDIPECHVHGGCDACPMLERGWSGLRVVT